MNDRFDAAAEAADLLHGIRDFRRGVWRSSTFRNVSAWLYWKTTIESTSPHNLTLSASADGPNKADQFA